MKDDINIRKVYKLQALVLKNALRLNRDSIILYKNESFPSAFYLSAISLEEIGKMFYLDDYIYLTHTGSKVNFNKDFAKRIHSHAHKQRRNAIEFRFEMGNNIIEQIEKGEIEKYKQKYLYVGLPNDRGKVALKGRIIDPFSINMEKVKKQITLINDQLLYFTLGLYIDVLCLTGLDVNDFFEFVNRKTIAQLQNDWPHRGKKFSMIITSYLKKYNEVKALTEKEYLNWINE